MTDLTYIRSYACGLAGRSLKVIDDGTDQPYYAPSLNTINIPASSLAEDMLDRVPAWIAHEVGHARYTPKEPYKGSAYLKRLTNAIEDARIEKEMSACFAGCRGYLLDCANNMFGTPPEQSDNIATNIFNYTLIKGRVLLYKSKEMTESLETIKGYIDPAILKQIDSIFSAIPSTFDEVLETAKKIEKLVKDNGGDDQEQGDQSQDSQGGDSDSDSDSNKKPNQSQQGDGDGGDQPVQANQSGGSDDDSDNNNSKGKKRVVDVDDKAINPSIIPSADSEKSQDKKEKSAETKVNNHEREKETESRFASTPSKRQVQEWIRRDVGTKIASRLQVRARAIVKKRQTGILDPARITHLFTDNIGLFKTKNIYKSNDREVAILVDASGSMDKVAPIISGISYSVMTGLREVKGVRSSLWSYNQYGTKCLVGEKDMVTLDKCIISADGGTPTELGLVNAVMGSCSGRLCYDLILITDGEPNDQRAFLEVANKLSKSGIRLTALGISLTEYAESQLKLGIPNTINFIDRDLPKLGNYIADLLTR